VLTECSGSGIEIPDAIGWKGSGGRSILVECKVSRSDFRADAKKVHRHPMIRSAVGQSRYYLVPRGLLAPEEVPEKWGLLEVRGATIKVLKKAVPFPHENVAVWREMAIMWSELRKTQIVQHGGKLLPSAAQRRIYLAHGKAEYTFERMKLEDVQVASDLADSIYPLSLHEPSESFQSRFDLYPEGAHVIRLNAEVVGYCFFHPIEEDLQVVPLGTVFTSFPKSTMAYAHDMAIAMSHRRKGLGTSFVDYVLKQMEAQDFKECRGVAVMNSESFWRKCGFDVNEALDYHGVPARKLSMRIIA